MGARLALPGHTRSRVAHPLPRRHRPPRIGDARQRTRLDPPAGRTRTSPQTRRRRTRRLPQAPQAHLHRVRQALAGRLPPRPQPQAHHHRQLPANTQPAPPAGLREAATRTVRARARADRPLHHPEDESRPVGKDDHQPPAPAAGDVEDSDPLAAHPPQPCRRRQPPPRPPAGPQRPHRNRDRPPVDRIPHVGGRCRRQ